MTSSAGFEDPVHEVAEERLRLHRPALHALDGAPSSSFSATPAIPSASATSPTASPTCPAARPTATSTDLQTAGLVRRVAANDEFARFELAEDLTEHHHHLLCVRCGKVTDVTPSAAFERQVTLTVDELAAAEGFEPHSHRLDVLGLCAACR